jgi:carbon storage regulator
VLILSRRLQEEIVIGGVIRVVATKVRGDRVWIGIDAPKDVSVHRREIQQQIEADRNGHREGP